MENSKTYGANERPACGRAVAGKWEIETSSAGTLSSCGSLTGCPVSGFTLAGKSDGFGPNVTGRAVGCAVGVALGTAGAVAVAAADAGCRTGAAGASVWALGAAHPFINRAS